ncbi:YHS domain-containing protein [Georgenia phoenicis]|uniref:YHS domain-containing protein n=1 Tax=unclassified Georgenia TaxID=2626815 RepID=UPI0039AFAF9D
MEHGREDHGGGCCGGGGHEHTHDHHGVVAGPGDELVTCAVTGTAQVKSQAEASGLIRDFEGERYYFCCAHCAELFDANPHAYTTAA